MTLFDIAKTLVRADAAMLRANRNTVERSLPAVVRLASNAAWADLDEYVRATNGVRP